VVVTSDPLPERLAVARVDAGLAAHHPQTAMSSTRERTLLADKPNKAERANQSLQRPALPAEAWL